MDNVNSIKLTFRDKAHFYKVVHWLNRNVGKGKEHWTINGKVLKHFANRFASINENIKPVSRNIIIHNTEIDLEETRIYLTLI